MTFAHQTNGRPDPDSFDVRGSLRGIVQAVRNHKWLVSITCLLTVGLVLAYIVIWPPIYTASAYVAIERDVDPQRDMFYRDWNVFRKEDAQSELELIKSGPILKEVIKQEQLVYDDVYHPFLSHVSYLWEQSSIGKFYRSVKADLFPPDTADAPTPEEIDLARTTIDMGAGISIEPIGMSNVGKLTVRGPTRRVADYANTLLDVYLARRKEKYKTEAQKSYEHLSDQVRQAEDAVMEIEVRRLAFVEEHGLAFDFQKESIEVTKLTDLEESMSMSRLNIAGMEASLAEVENQLEEESPVAKTSAATELNAIRESMKMRRLDLENLLTLTRTRFTEDSPEVREVKSNLAALEDMLVDATEMVQAGETEGQSTVRVELVSRRNKLLSDLAGARAGLAVQEQTAAGLQRRMDEVPALRSQLHALDREHGLAQVKFGELESIKAQAEASLAAATAATQSMRVVEYATAPHKPWWPKTKILLPAAFLLGLILGVGAALIRTYTSGRIRRDQIAQGHGALPLYGTIQVANRGRPLEVLPPVEPTIVSLDDDPRLG